MDPPRRPTSSPLLWEVYLRSDGGYSDFPPARVRESIPDQFSPPPFTRELPLSSVVLYSGDLQSPVVPRRARIRSRLNCGALQASAPSEGSGLRIP